MKKIFFLIFVICIVHHAFAQEKDLVKIADSITAEGKTLFKSEWASWYGTDIFTEKCKARRAIAGGYISYDSGKGLVNVFFSKDAEPVVLSTISFGYYFDPNNFKLDTLNRKLTQQEKELFTIRKTAIAELNKDTLFKKYNHTNLNPIPIIENNTKKVYVLTGPEVNGVVIFGNDYLIDFDRENNIIDKKTLHKNIIPLYTDKDSTGTTTFHVHLAETGDFITATDICTLLLYEKFTKWSQHFVRSKEYISIWDCKKDQLLIMTVAAINRIQEDQKKRH